MVAIYARVREAVRSYYDPSQARDKDGRWTDKAGQAAHHTDQAGKATDAQSKRRHLATALGAAALHAHEQGDSGKRDGHLKDLGAVVTALRIQVHHAKKSGKADDHPEVKEREAAYRHYQGMLSGLKEHFKGKGKAPDVRHFGEKPAKAEPVPEPKAPEPEDPYTTPPDTTGKSKQMAEQMGALASHLKSNGHDHLGEAARQLGHAFSGKIIGHTPIIKNGAEAALEALKHHDPKIHPEIHGAILKAAHGLLGTTPPAPKPEPKAEPEGSKVQAHADHAEKLRRTAAIIGGGSPKSRVTQLAGVHGLLAQAHGALAAGDHATAKALGSEAETQIKGATVSSMPDVVAAHKHAADSLGALKAGVGGSWEGGSLKNMGKYAHLATATTAHTLTADQHAELAEKAKALDVPGVPPQHRNYARGLAKVHEHIASAMKNPSSVDVHDLNSHMTALMAHSKGLSETPKFAHLHATARQGHKTIRAAGGLGDKYAAPKAPAPAPEPKPKAPEPAPASKSKSGAYKPHQTFNEENHRLLAQAAKGQSFTVDGHAALADFHAAMSKGDEKAAHLAYARASLQHNAASSDWGSDTKTPERKAFLKGYAHASKFMADSPTGKAMTMYDHLNQVAKSDAMASDKIKPLTSAVGLVASSFFRKPEEAKTHLDKAEALHAGVNRDDLPEEVRKHHDAFPALLAQARSLHGLDVPPTPEPPKAPAPKAEPKAPEPAPAPTPKGKKEKTGIGAAAAHNAKVAKALSVVQNYDDLHRPDAIRKRVEKKELSEGHLHLARALETMHAARAKVKNGDLEGAREAHAQSAEHLQKAAGVDMKGIHTTYRTDAEKAHAALGEVLKAGGIGTKKAFNEEGKVSGPALGAHPGTKLLPVHASGVKAALLEPKIHTALDAIAKVHGLPGDAKPLALVGRKSIKGGSTQGTYSGAGTIELNATGSHTATTLAHEIGHWIDNRILAGGLKFGSENPDQHMKGVMDAIKATDSYKELKGFQSKSKHTYISDTGKEITTPISASHVAYLLKDREAFARAYAQYIAHRSGDPEMKQQVEKIRGDKIYGARHWHEHEFEPVAQAFDKLFQAKGLRK